MDFSIPIELTEDLERFKEFIKAQQAGLGERTQNVQKAA